MYKLKKYAIDNNLYTYKHLNMGLKHTNVYI